MQIEESHDLKLQYLSLSDALAYMIKFGLILKSLLKEVCFFYKGYCCLGGKSMGTYTISISFQLEQKLALTTGEKKYL